MESFIDKVARTYNGIETRTMEGAIGEAKRLSKDFQRILATKVVNNGEKIETPEETRKKAMGAISDFEDMYRPEAGNVPNDMLYQNNGNMIEDAMNSLNTIDNYNTQEQNAPSTTIQNNEGIDR